MNPKRQKASKARLAPQASHQPPKAASVQVNPKRHLSFASILFFNENILIFFAGYFQAFLTKMGLYECILIENIKKITGTFQFILQRYLESCGPEMQFGYKFLIKERNFEQDEKVAEVVVVPSS